MDFKQSEDVIVTRRNDSRSKDHLMLLSEDGSMNLPQKNDKYNFDSTPFSRFTFYMVGIGLLLPWNAVMAAMDFFKTTFPEDEGYKPSFTLLVAVSGPMLIG